MNDYNSFHHFEISKSTYINELGCELVELKHKATECPLYILEREDTNKTFAIGFRTIPEDSSGVFHILEHSVLCGSHKFPLKDPFGELIKSSSATFLNAMTYGEKTLYPVASKNDKAFFGLVDVYLDAVFHPNVLENPYIFMQEGYRYELNGKELTINGVVYNEMKAAYSSADEYALYIMSKLLEPSGTYSHDSGGNPSEIPSLTYEQFKCAHEKFYHPSNAFIFLDGSVNYEEIIPLISEYLEVYSKSDFSPKINPGLPHETEPHTGYYPLSDSEDDANKSRIYLAYPSFPYKNREDNLALTLICEALADSNFAPLTKKILGTGLCESFSFYSTMSNCKNHLSVKFTGVKDGKRDELLQKYNSAITSFMNGNIPKDNLESALSRIEFSTREADYGPYPKGILYMTTCLEAAALYEEPAGRFMYEDVFNSLNNKLNTAYYDDLLKQVLTQKPCDLTLLPDKKFTERQESELKKELKSKLDSMSADEITKLKLQNAGFKKWQDSADTESAVASIPKLKLGDLNPLPDETPTRVEIIGNTEIVIHQLKTGGITYAELYFDASDADAEEMQYLRLYDELIGEWNTNDHTASEFNNMIKKHLGVLFNMEKPIKKASEAKLYSTVTLSFLDTKAEAASKLLYEHLYLRRFENKELLIQNIKQLYSYSCEAIAERGDKYARLRCASRYSPFDAIMETVDGYEFHAFLKKLANDIDNCSEKVLDKFKDICSKYYRTERLTVGITGENALNTAEILLRSIKSGGKKSDKCTLVPFDRINEGIAIPFNTACAAMASNLHEVKENAYTGAFATLSNILSNEILLDRIRIKGGAYDTGFSARANSGGIVTYSYADPTPIKSIKVFRSLTKLARDFIAKNPDPEKFIIGAVGSSDTVKTPRFEGTVATARYLSEITNERIRQLHEETLRTKSDELLELCDLVGDAFKKATYTIVASPKILKKDSSIDKILEI